MYVSFLLAIVVRTRRNMFTAISFFIGLSVMSILSKSRNVFLRVSFINKLAVLF